MSYPAKFLVMCALLMGACQTGPEARGIQVTEDHKIYNQEKAMFTLEYLINDHYDVDITDLALSSTVYWTDTKCPYRDEWAVVYKGICHFGRMWSCSEMYVAKRKDSPNNTCGTALLHEYGHCIRQSLGMSTSGDDHWDDEFWAIVAEANGLSCDREWTAKEISDNMDDMAVKHEYYYDYSQYLE